MITAVLYDKETGKIYCTTQATLASLEADSRDWISVDTYSMTYDRTHKVENGQLVLVE